MSKSSKATAPMLVPPAEQHSDACLEAARREACRMQKAKKGVAFHEAGHAVLRWVLNHPFKYVTIIPNKKGDRVLDGSRQKHKVDGEGHVEPLKPPSWVFGGKGLFREKLSARRQRFAENEIMIQLAPIFAQACRGIAVHNKIQFGYDLDNVEKWLGYIAPLSYEDNCYANPLFTTLRSRTLELVRTFWPQIEATAEELLARRTLSYSEFLDVVEASLPAHVVRIAAAVSKAKSKQARLWALMIQANAARADHEAA